MEIERPTARAKEAYIRRFGDPFAKSRNPAARWDEFLSLHHRRPFQRTETQDTRLSRLLRKVNGEKYDELFKEASEESAREGKRRTQLSMRCIERASNRRESRAYEKISIRERPAAEWERAIGRDGDLESMRSSELGFACKGALNARELLVRARIHSGLLRRDVKRLHAILREMMPAKEQQVLGPILSEFRICWYRRKPWALTEDEQFVYFAGNAQQFRMLDERRRTQMARLIETGVALEDHTREHYAAYKFRRIRRFSPREWRKAIGERWDESHHESELGTCQGSHLSDIRDILIKARVHSGLIRDDLVRLQDLVSKQAREYDWPPGAPTLAKILRALGIRAEIK